MPRIESKANKMTQPTNIRAVDHLGRAQSLVLEIAGQDSARGERLWAALRNSVGAEDRDVSQIDPGDPLPLTALELSTSSRFSLEELCDLGIVLRRVQAQEYLKHRGVAFRSNKFKSRTKLDSHAVRLGPNRLAMYLGYIYTYAEIATLMNESMSFELRR